MLTFDKIREFERAERGSRKLQMIPNDIVMHIRDYMKRKQKIADKTTADLAEMENIMSTIKRLFELREGKLLAAVPETARTGIPPENMTIEEKEIFYRLVDTLKTYREKFFQDINKEDKKEALYKILSDIPPFVGPDMKTYEFKAEQIVALPGELEEFMVKNKLAEKVEDS
jgi:DNA replication initiation complex subunit (GINS family)